MLDSLSETEAYQKIKHTMSNLPWWIGVLGVGVIYDRIKKRKIPVKFTLVSFGVYVIWKSFRTEENDSKVHKRKRKRKKKKELSNPEKIDILNY